MICLVDILLACNRHASLTNASPTIVVVLHCYQCCLHPIIWLFNFPLLQLFERRLSLWMFIFAYTLQMCDSILFVEDEESVDQLLLMVMVEFQAND